MTAEEAHLQINQLPPQKKEKFLAELDTVVDSHRNKGPKANVSQSNLDKSSKSTLNDDENTSSRRQASKSPGRSNAKALDEIERSITKSANTHDNQGAERKPRSGLPTVDNVAISQRQGSKSPSRSNIKALQEIEKSIKYKSPNRKDNSQLEELSRSAEQKKRGKAGRVMYMEEPSSKDTSKHHHQDQDSERYDEQESADQSNSNSRSNFSGYSSADSPFERANKDHGKKKGFNLQQDLSPIPAVIRENAEGSSFRLPAMNQSEEDQENRSVASRHRSFDPFAKKNPAPDQYHSQDSSRLNKSFDLNQSQTQHNEQRRTKKSQIFDKSPSARERTSQLRDELEDVMNMSASRNHSVIKSPGNLSFENQYISPSKVASKEQPADNLKSTKPQKTST